MKRALLASAISVLSMFALSSCSDGGAEPAAVPVKPLRVEGTQLVDDAGQPVVLRGVSLGWHNFWPRFFNAGAVAWLKQDWGIDVIRAPLGVTNKYPENAYHAKPEQSVALIREVVDAAIAEGLYVIIDWHSHETHLKDAKAFFKEVARSYGEHPNVIYEIFNEPEEQTWPEIKAYAEEVVAAIRAIDPDNLILVGTPRWAQNVDEAADDRLAGVSNVMYTLHYYAATHGEELREKGDYALENGLPLFISESAGMEATGDGPMDYENWQKWRDWAEARKISWITWSVADKDETCSFLYPSAASDGGWSDSDLKESAKATRGILRRFKGLD